MKPTTEVLQAIETAIQIEKDGLAFYNESARQTDDPNGKKMFQSLARDEILRSLRSLRMTFRLKCSCSTKPRQREDARIIWLPRL